MNNSRAYAGIGIGLSSIWLIIAFVLQINAWVRELKHIPNPYSEISVIWPIGVLAVSILIQILADIEEPIIKK